MIWDRWMVELDRGIGSRMFRPHYIRNPIWQDSTEG